MRDTMKELKHARHSRFLSVGGAFWNHRAVHRNRSSPTGAAEIPAGRGACALESFRFLLEKYAATAASRPRLRFLSRGCAGRGGREDPINARGALLDSSAEPRGKPSWVPVPTSEQFSCY